MLNYLNTQLLCLFWRGGPEQQTVQEHVPMTELCIKSGGNGSSLVERDMLAHAVTVKA